MKSLDNAYYIALSFDISKANLKAYRRYLHEQVRPFYETLKNKKTLQDYSIYLHKATAEKHGNFPTWNVLHVIHINQRKDAASFMADWGQLQSFPNTVIVRQELLVSTPRSHFPMTDSLRKHWLKPMQVVEHVDVQVDKLHTFRNIMIERNGPAMNYILSERSWCSSFYALETEEIWQHHPQYPTWNQIHIIALFPTAPLWYKKDFGHGLANTGLSFDENLAELKQIRTMRYKTISSLL